MKIEISFPAYFVDAETDVEAPPPDFPACYVVEDGRFADHLDAPVADQGVVGDGIRVLRVDRRLVVTVSYRCPHVPAKELIDALGEYTTAQLNDGIGEGGWPYPTTSGDWLIVADTAPSPEIQVVDDGQFVPGPPQIAIAARNGEVARLETLLAISSADLERLHQGYTALHLAVIYGHGAAAAMLLTAGADPNQLDPLGQTPLELCALARDLSDEQSRDVARLLLEAGADPSHRTPTGETAGSYAEMRRKPLLAALL